MYHGHQKRSLVLDTMSHWQPVQLLQRRTNMMTDQVWIVQRHSAVVVEGWRLIEVSCTELHCSSRVDWRWRRTPAASWCRWLHDIGVAVAVVDGKSRCCPSCWHVVSWSDYYQAGCRGHGQLQSVQWLSRRFPGHGMLWTVTHPTINWAA